MSRSGLKMIITVGRCESCRAIAIPLTKNNIRSLIAKGIAMRITTKTANITMSRTAKRMKASLFVYTYRLCLSLSLTDF